MSGARIFASALPEVELAAVASTHFLSLTRFKTKEYCKGFAVGLLSNYRNFLSLLIPVMTFSFLTMANRTTTPLFKVAKLYSERINIQQIYLRKFGIASVPLPAKSPEAISYFLLLNMDKAYI